MPHAPNHQQRQDRRVSGGPNQASTLTLNDDPYGIKSKAVSIAGNAIGAPVTKAIGSAMPTALGGGGAGLAALTPLMGPLALAGIAGKVFGFFNEGTTDVQNQAQELAQSVTDQNKRTMRAPMQYAKGVDNVDDLYDKKEEMKRLRMMREGTDYPPLDGILKFPDEIDPYFFDDSRRMIAVPPMMMASNTITPAYGSIPVPTYEGDPAQLELFSIPGLPTQSYEEKMYYQDADVGRLNKGTASVEPKQLEMFAIPGRQGQSYEEKIYYQDADSGKLNRGTRRVSLPADPMMSMQKTPMPSGLGSMAAGLAPMQHHYLPNVKGNSLKNIIAHEEFKKNPPYIPMAPLGPQDFGGGTHKVAGINPQKYASGTPWAQSLSNKSDGTFVPDFIKPLVESGGYTPGMDPDSIRYQHLHNTGTLPAIQPMPTPGPFIGPLSDRQMKNQLHEQKMMHNEQRHNKQMMTT